MKPGDASDGEPDPSERTPDSRVRAPDLRDRAKEWLRRYLPLEIVATLTAIAGGLATAVVTSNPVAIAYGGTWGENVGYYGLAFGREMREQRARVPQLGLWARSGAAVRRLTWEFGVAELVDSFVSRPACMFAAMALLSSLELAIIAGKLAADAIFYTIAIVFYELGKRRN